MMEKIIKRLQFMEGQDYNIVLLFTQSSDGGINGQTIPDSAIYEPLNVPYNTKYVFDPNLSQQENEYIEQVINQANDPLVFRDPTQKIGIRGNLF